MVEAATLAMANHRATAALLLIASLYVAVAVARADARTTMGPNKTAALRHDADGQGYTADAAVSTVSEADPTCDDGEQTKTEPPTCEDNCEEPKPKPEPPTCNTCEHPEAPEPEPQSELTCNKVHGVREDETCWCLAQGVGLTLEDFLSINPNLCCDNLFIGQWVCLSATTGCHD